MGLPAAKDSLVCLSAYWLKTRAGGRVGLTAVGGWLRWEGGIRGGDIADL
jgi:hypothetical protein